MAHLFVPQEDDFKKWIREAIREELKTFTADRKTADSELDEPLMNRKEVGAYLRISLVTLHDWMKRGFPHHRKRGRVFFLKSEVLNWVKENRKGDPSAYPRNVRR